MTCEDVRNELFAQLDGTRSWGESSINLIRSIRDYVAGKTGWWCTKEPTGGCCAGWAALLTALNGHEEAMQGFGSDCNSIQAAIEAINCHDGSDWQDATCTVQSRLTSLHNLALLLHEWVMAGAQERDRLNNQCVQTVPPVVEPPVVMDAPRMARKKGGRR